MRIIGVLFTVILLSIPSSRCLSRIDDDSLDYEHRDFNIFSTRAAVERVPLQFER